VREIDLEGLKKILGRDPKDTRPLLINFWATWCDGCREEFPDLVKIDNDYRDKGLNFVSVSLDEVSDIKTEVPKFLKSMNARMNVVLLNVKDPEPAIHAVDATWDGALLTLTWSASTDPGAALWVSDEPMNPNLKGL